MRIYCGSCWFWINYSFPENQQHTFHLSMAQLRILRLQRGEGDHLVNAVQVILDKKRII